MRAARIRAQATSGKPTTLREFLLRQDPAWLADELLRSRTLTRWSRRGSRRRPGRIGPAWWTCPDCWASWTRRSFPGGYIECGAAFGYARGIDRVLDQVEDLTVEGFPDAAIEAAEHALDLLEEAFGQVDDSPGELGAVKARGAGHLLVRV